MYVNSTGRGRKKTTLYQRNAANLALFLFFWQLPTVVLVVVLLANALKNKMSEEEVQSLLETVPFFV
jgi:hypothetical protein